MFEINVFSDIMSEIQTFVMADTLFLGMYLLIQTLMDIFNMTKAFEEGQFDN